MMACCQKISMKQMIYGNFYFLECESFPNLLNFLAYHSMVNKITSMQSLSFLYILLPTIDSPQLFTASAGYI
jgi:hypothetical protein